MKSQRSILALRYTPVSVAGGVRRAVGGFLRYVQYRDQHLEPGPARGIDAYVRYVAHRDRTSPARRVFDRDGSPTEADRRGFVDFVARSTRNLEPKWVRDREGSRRDRQRAVYTFILSPEDWRGLDLRLLARSAMRQLEADAGPGGIGPWLAAEHRNTAHHHVHIVLAARREVSPGRFSAFVITRARLQRMKDAIASEIDRQRGREFARTTTPFVSHSSSPSPGRPNFCRGHRPLHWRGTPRSRERAAPNPVSASMRGRRFLRAPATLFRLRALALRYRERVEQNLEQESIRAEREGWVR